MANKNKLKKGRAARATAKPTNQKTASSGGNTTNSDISTTGMGMDARTGKMLKKHDIKNIKRKGEKTAGY